MPRRTRPRSPQPARPDDRELESSGWQRDDFGFRGPIFHAVERARHGVNERYEPHARSFRTWGSEHEPPSGRGKGPRGFVRSDERIREDVCERLTDADVDASDIDVRVTGGEVTLTGTVEDRGSKRAAEDVAWGACGVKDCHNRLRIASRDDPRADSPSNDGRPGTSRSADGG